MYIGVSGYVATKEGQLLPKGEGGEKEVFVPSFPTSSLSFAVFEDLLSSLLKSTASVNCCEA